MGDGYRIESATPADASAVAAIYAHHVNHGTASFEIEPPSDTEMAGRMAKVLDAGAPWLVARDPSGEVIGYAYASQFRDRPAYRYACENSIYIQHDRRGEGIGRALLALLIVAAERRGFRQMIAVIAGAEPASVRLHAACGFAETGRMRSVGRKAGRWLDTLYMQRPLGHGDDTPPAEEPA
ncbi:MAG: N-acetyltransferase family protein [Novosphingobium sp.]|nr:N-acetyltransferase family protein [Novosphingobium sp.]